MIRKLLAVTFSNMRTSGKEKASKSSLKLNCPRPEMKSYKRWKMNYLAMTKTKKRSRSDLIRLTLSHRITICRELKWSRGTLDASIISAAAISTLTDTPTPKGGSN